MRARVIGATVSMLLLSLASGWAQSDAQPQATQSTVEAVNSPATQASAAPSTDESLPPITVQVAPPPISIEAQLGISGPLGAQATPGKAVYAEFETHHTQSFTDGNHISRVTHSYLYRDVKGRIRRESQLSMPGLAEGASSRFITIIDRQLGCGYVLNPQEMVAHRYALNSSGSSYVARINAQGNGDALLPPGAKHPAAAASPSGSSSGTSSGSTGWTVHSFMTAHHKAVAGSMIAEDKPGDNPSLAGTSSFAGKNMKIDQPFLAAPNPMRTENLGEQKILGFRALGTRVITTLPAGQIGNDRPIDIITEQWFSPELDLVMRSMHRDPWAGEFTTTVTRIKRGDQPELLFAVPEHYKVVDAATENEHHILDGSGNRVAP